MIKEATKPPDPRPRAGVILLFAHGHKQDRRSRPCGRWGRRGAGWADSYQILQPSWSVFIPAPRRMAPSGDRAARLGADAEAHSVATAAAGRRMSLRVRSRFRVAGDGWIDPGIAS
jgi:hypothetical protein